MRVLFRRPRIRNAGTSTAIAALLLSSVPALNWAQSGTNFPSRQDVPESRFMYSDSQEIATNATVSVVPSNATQFSINGGNFTNDRSPILAGQTLTIRHLSANQPGTTTTSTINLGGVVSTFVTRTAGEPPAPPPLRVSIQQIGSGGGDQTFSLPPICTEVTENEEFDCPANTAITITADEPAGGTYFTGWYDVPECTHRGLDGPDAARPYNPDCLILLTQARSLVASYAEIPAPTPANEADAPTCDNTVSQHCFFPFPSNVFTRAPNQTDPSNHTGLQVNLVTAGRFPTPRPDDNSTGGGTFDPIQWNRNDGFSVNPKINSFIDTNPGASQVGADENDLDATGVTHLADLSTSLLPDAPVLLINATPLIDENGNPCTDGETCVANPDYLARQLIWVEPELPKRELRDTDGDGRMDTRVIPDSERSLTIRVAKNLNYRHRYIVALRNFKRAFGSRIEAEPLFRIYRDNQVLGPTFPNMEARRAEMEDIFTILAEADVERWELNQAWDFTVVSRENLHKRIVHMRNTAIDALGETDIPCYTVEVFPNASIPEQIPNGPVSPPYNASACPAGEIPTALPGNSGITANPRDRYQRQVDGTIAVPCFMTGNCAPGSELNYNPASAQGEHPVFGDDLPDQIPGSIFKANWRCNIPDSASAANPARISLYGHGLLGSLAEVSFAGDVRRFADDHNVVMCAMNWTGFATEDAGTAAQIGGDVSAFSTFIDRQMQGHIAWLMLQELIVRDGGLRAHPAMQDDDGNPLYRLDFNSDGSGGLFYDGNSQGGIMSAAILTLSDRITRGVMGVPGMNYSILLRRSVDFQTQDGEEPGIGATGINVVLQNNYPNDFDLSFIYSLSTMIWERSENAGFVHHLGNNPLPLGGARPIPKPTQVLLHVGYGDHQVAMWTADIIARSAGMSRMEPMVIPERYDTNHPTSGPVYGEQQPYFDIPIINNYPHAGGALVYWDSGNPPVDTQVLYNAPQQTGSDPHGHPRSSRRGQLQKSLFLMSDQSGGGLFDTCSPTSDGSSNGQDGGPCLSDDR